jgi:hypothetical protein
VASRDHPAANHRNIVEGKPRTTSLHEGDASYEVDWVSLDDLIDEGIDLWAHLPRTSAAAIARARHLCARQS